MKKILILIVVILLTTGCFDCQELNNMNIVTGIGFDKKGDEYLISLEVTKNEDSNDSGQKVSQIFSAKDKNLATAMNKAFNASNKKVYLKHVDVILISEEIAKDGISPIIDYLLRENNISSTFFTAICNNANDVLNLELEKDTASDFIISTITSHIEVGILNNIDIITSNILNKRKDIALPFIEVIDNDKLMMTDKAYFDEDKMVGITSNKIYNFLELNNKDTVFDNDDNVLKIFNKKVNYKVEKDTIVINISGKGKIVSLNGNDHLDNKDDYLKIEKMINEEINKEVNEFLKDTLSYNSDLLGFEDLYYKKYKKEMPEIDILIKSNISLVRNGPIMEVISD